MPCEQGDLSTSVDIVEPDAEVAGHRQPGAIGRIGHGPIAFTGESLAQAEDGTLRQPPAGMVLSLAARRERHGAQQEGNGEDDFIHLGPGFAPEEGTREGVCLRCNRKYTTGESVWGGSTPGR